MLLAALSALAAPPALQAAPLRLDIEGPAAAEFVDADATDPLPIQFVPAGTPVVATAEGDEMPPDRVASNDLRAPDLSAERPLLTDSRTVHADWMAAARLAADDMPADGTTAGAVLSPGDLPTPFDGAPAADHDAPELAATPAATTAAMVDVERLHIERSAIQWVVVPLVLVALLMAWRGSKAQRRQRNPMRVSSVGGSSSGRRRTRRASASAE